MFLRAIDLQILFKPLLVIGRICGFQNTVFMREPVKELCHLIKRPVTIKSPGSKIFFIDLFYLSVKSVILKQAVFPFCFILHIQMDKLGSCRHHFRNILHQRICQLIFKSQRI